MKRLSLYALIALFVFSLFEARPALAQSEIPPAGPVGEIRGTVINRNTGKVVAESLEVMLHVLDQDFAELDMKHAQSGNDGTFAFADIPFDANLQFVVMAIYNDVAYSSDPAPVNSDAMQVVIDVPVYETTTDLSSVQIDQMHVLFDFAEDGLETKEIYVISSSSERTVKDVYQLTPDQTATLKFPLPEDADYIFFKPEEQDRFVKFKDGFADTSPILPSTESLQLMVSYLVPYSGEREYTYTAPMNVAQISFLVPDQAGVSLQGSGLTELDPMTLQNGETYKVYSYLELKAGQTVNLSIRGKVVSELDNLEEKASNTPLAVGIALLGLAIMGAGIWWWYRPENTQDEIPEVVSSRTALDDLIIEIAKLDEDFEQGKLSPEAHQQLRQELMGKAKHLL
jgi:hypothetical protein